MRLSSLIPRQNPWLLLIGFSAVTAQLQAADSVADLVNDPIEQSALSHFANLFENPPKISGDPASGEIQLEKRKEDKKGSGSLKFKVEAGHVVSAQGNRAALSDDQFSWFQPFSQLQAIKLDHNFDNKQTEAIEFDGSGLEALTGLEKLTVIRLAGGNFADPGAAAAAKIEALEELVVFHTQVTDAGLKHFENHPSLQVLVLGPAYAENGITNDSMATLANIPKLKEVSLNEMILTWEGGLENLVPGKDHFEVINFARSAIPPQDLARLREAMPETTIEHIGYQELLNQFDEGTLKFGGRLKRNVPEQLLQQMRLAVENNE